LVNTAHCLRAHSLNIGCRFRAPPLCVCCTISLCLKLTSCTAGRVDLVFQPDGKFAVERAFEWIWLWCAKALRAANVVWSLLLNAKFVNEIYAAFVCRLGAHWKLSLVLFFTCFLSDWIVLGGWAGTLKSNQQLPVGLLGNQRCMYF